MNQYEVMFLFDSGFANDYSRVESEIDRLMERAEAQLVFAAKWDERKLAYEIQGRRRGTYVLCYFRSGPDRISGIERDVQLSEHVLRCLIVRADHVTKEEMERSVSPGYREEPSTSGPPIAAAAKRDRKEASVGSEPAAVAIAAGEASAGVEVSVPSGGSAVADSPEGDVKSAPAPATE